VLGVIGLVCSTDEDRARVLGHKDVYVQFIERCAEFILHKLHDHADLLRARSFLDIMLRILEINSRGIVIFNAKGGISYLNDIARRDLGLKDDGLPTDVQFKRTGESFSDLEEFVVPARSRKHTLMGQMTPLAPSDYHFATVFTFESLPRMADRVSSLGDSLSGVETLVGRSPAMLQLKDQIRQIAGSTSTVLVTGESGTGKELVTVRSGQVDQWIETHVTFIADKPKLPKTTRSSQAAYRHGRQDGARQAIGLKETGAAGNWTLEK